MEPFRRRLQLDRQELLLLFCVFFLISGLMFTLGVMIGYGVKPKDDAHAVAGHAAHGAHHGAPDAHDKDHGDGHGKEKGEGHAAGGKDSKKKKKDGDGSATLAKMLENDKQKALTEGSLTESGGDEPKSVQDAQAHFAANPAPTPARQPASEPAKPAKKETKEKAVTPDRVKALFERRPAGSDKFAPTGGSFTVQIASFASEDESSAKVRVLRGSGFNESYVQAIKLSNGEVWYRVAVGSFPSPVWAKKTGEKLVRRGLASDFVIRKIP